MLVVEETRFPCPEVTALLQRVVWGSPGGVRYQVPEPVDERGPAVPIDGAERALGEHRLFLARRDGRLVGSLLLVRRPDAWLSLLFAVEPDQRGTGVGRLLAEHVASLPLDAPVHGTIEATNRGSLHVAGPLWPHHSPLEILTVSRRFPRRSPGCTAEGARFRITRDGQSAGVLLVPHRWRLVRLPGVQQALLPALPLLLGTSAADYRFGMLHDWWGPPALYDALFTHALAATGLTSALVVGDPDDAGFRAIRDTVRRGVVGRLAGVQRMTVVSSHPRVEPFRFGPFHAL
ncbi:MAG: GNAT family N-acetyltransferase [Alphaproteobacteria bacterium]|nr:GNAT family N-acetyltransferase [Alphaproteobacteria bacterium]